MSFRCPICNSWIFSNAINEPCPHCGGWGFTDIRFQSEHQQLNKRRVRNAGIS